MRDTSRNLLQMLAASMALTAWTLQGAVTIHTATGGANNRDTWSDPGSWDNGAPTGTIDIEIGAGNAAAALDSVGLPAAYTGNFKLNTGSSIEINGSNSSLLNVFGTGTVTMGANSRIYMRYNSSLTLDRSFALLGDAAIYTGRSTSGHHRTHNYNGVFSGGHTLTFQGVNNQTINLNATNAFSGFVADRLSGTNYRIRTNAANALGVGDVTIGDTVSLHIDNASAISSSAVLTLTGGRDTKLSASKLTLNQDATVTEFWYNSFQYGPGTYDSTSGLTDQTGFNLIGGTGTLTVIPEPAFAALLGLGALSLCLRRRRK